MELGITGTGRALEAALEMQKHSESRLDPSLLPRRRSVRIAPGSDYSSENTVSSECTFVKVEDDSNVPTSTPDENNHIEVPEISRGVLPEAAPANGDQDSVNSLEATVEVQELPENKLVPIHFVPGGKPLPNVTLSPGSTIVKEKHDVMESETAQGLSNSAELPDSSISGTQDGSLLSDSSERAVMSTDSPRRRVFDWDQHLDEKLRPAIRLTTNTGRTSTGKQV